MSEKVHPWCRDTARDDAIRRAEDDAANWRRLEVGEVVQEGDEYLNGNAGWQCVRKSFVGRPMDRGYVPHRRRRVPLPDHRELPQAVAELRERVGKIEEAMVSGSTWFPKSDQPAPTPPPAPPQITEGDTLATVRDGGGRPMPKGPPPGLRAGKREAAPASRDAVNVPLYAAPVAESATTPQPPRGWLTAEEREAVKSARLHLSNSDGLDEATERECKWASDVFRRLLARETPPRVKVPVVVTGFTHREHAEGWVKAIRAAGVEVTE